MVCISKTTFYFTCLTLLGVFGAANNTDQECNSSVVSFTQCKANETCRLVGTKSICQCEKDFKRGESGLCELVSNDSSPSPSPNTADTSDAGGFGFKLILWLIVPVLLAVAIAGIVYTGRQKMWLNRLYRMRIRSYNNVMVNSQDEDDPPIA